MNARLTDRGLSPPTRGILIALRSRVSITRSIPAYAGDPGEVQERIEGAGVYPRLRGGSASQIHLHYAQIGLSPPTRGIPGRFIAGDSQIGSIPAYAGDPRRTANYERGREVYPRLRGGSRRRRRRRRRRALIGLSPPTRGIPPR